jgi:8-oxo-dGTP pyrophosphatase MutT (NUDIX family)
VSAGAARLPEVSRRLAEREPVRVDLDGTPARAAVAMVLEPRDDDVYLLFIQRAERAGDPWSGQMAFPGGFWSTIDPHLAETARRETLEEIGLDLATKAAPIARLDDLQGVARGRELPLVITPFLFELRGPAELRLNHEVQGTLWVPLAHLREDGNVGAIEYSGPGADAAMRLPAYRYEGRTIWGLTFRMVRNFVDLLGAKDRS